MDTAAHGITPRKKEVFRNGCLYHRRYFVQHSFGTQLPAVTRPTQGVQPNPLSDTPIIHKKKHVHVRAITSNLLPIHPFQVRHPAGWVHGAGKSCGAIGEASQGRLLCVTCATNPFLKSCSLPQAQPPLVHPLPREPLPEWREHAAQSPPLVFGQTKIQNEKACHPCRGPARTRGSTDGWLTPCSTYLGITTICRRHTQQKRPKKQTQPPTSGFKVSFA